MGLALLLASCTSYSKVGQVSERSIATTEAQREALRAARGIGNQPQDQIGTYLDSAADASRRLAANPADTEARSDYNFAVARVIETITDNDLAPWDAPINCASSGGRSWNLSLPPFSSRSELHPSNLRFYPADRYSLKGSLLGERKVKAGLGAPVVVQSANLDLSKLDEFALPEKAAYGLTAVLRFDGSACELALIDPLASETVSFEGRSYPLAADFQAPVLITVANLDVRKNELKRFFKPSRYENSAKLTRLQPYDPSKIPVLFVHGLSNSPAIWVPMIDYLREDPVIRQNYQIWVYGYPSGQPYPVPTAELRRKLDRIKQKYPDHKDVVLVGHSMGGMISRLLVTDSGLTLWNSAFDEPPGEIGVSQETLDYLTDLFIFKSRPDVSRVIYASASHRGSEDATTRLGKLGAKLIGDPVNENAITREAISATRPGAAANELHRVPNSVDVLNPDSPFLKAVDTIPVDPSIPFHSIIGDQGKGGNRSRTEPVSTDGIVPYWSSHLDGAESELIIPSGHWTILEKEAMEEVRRILYLHLKAQ